MCNAVRDAPDTQEPQREQRGSAPRGQTPNTEAPDYEPSQIERHEESQRHRGKPEQCWKAFMKPGEELFGEVCCLKENSGHRGSNRTPNVISARISPVPCETLKESNHHGNAEYSRAGQKAAEFLVHLRRTL